MKYKVLTVFIIGLIFMFSNVSSVFARTVTLSWNPNTENDLAGYKIFVKLASADYDTFYSVGKVVEYQLDLPDDENDYHLALKALDYSGNESGFSQEVVVEGNTTSRSAVEYVSLYPLVLNDVDNCLKSPCDGYISHVSSVIEPKVLSGEEPATGTKNLGLMLLRSSSSIPGAFRFFIPPGTVSASITISSDVDAQLAFRYQAPPSCTAYDAGNHSWDYTSLLYGMGQDVYRHGRYLMVDDGGHYLSLSESGWFYIKNLNNVPLTKVAVLITIDLAEFVAWYNGQEVRWDANGDPWSVDHGVNLARVCSVSDLDACRTEYECANVGANWYGGGCNAEVACMADDLYLCDDDQTRCANSGYYWYDDLCNEEAACTVDDFYVCDSQARCEGSGFYWDGNSCLAQSPCSRGVLSTCTSREDCRAGGGFWYNDECRQSMPTSSSSSGSYSPPSSSSSSSSSSGVASFSGLGSLFGMQTPCGPDNPGVCDQGACEALGTDYWWYGGCRSGQQIETYDDGRIAEALVRLGDDADDGTISAGEGMSILLDVPDDVRSYALLVFPNGEYYFLDNNDLITKRVVSVTSGQLPVSDNLCSVLEEVPELTGKWLVAFLTVPTSVGQFQSLNDIVDYLNSGGVYHFGSYSVMVDCQ